MLSKIPIDINKVKQEDLDREILRASIITKLDAINLYEEMANMTDNEDLKTVLLDVAGEEKTHVGEFQTMILRMDEEKLMELAKGRNEVKELTGKNSLTKIKSILKY